MESEEIKMKNPCKPNCPKRCATCHGNCKEYADFRAWLDSINAKRKAEQDAIHFIRTVHSARFA